ncbi:uncharacterized protein LOC104861336 [Fukomys damarensis]|uniref:uncharacterized protein LOC104861336 n=1 Tax=Fukomys damarensis TaxID=885580 RepID=UPI00145530F0|nr:uncharacterized protein LOC104861336 [Fukomys damarensis]
MGKEFKEQPRPPLPGCRHRSRHRKSCLGPDLGKGSHALPCRAAAIAPALGGPAWAQTSKRVATPSWVATPSPAGLPPSLQTPEVLLGTRPREGWPRPPLPTTTITPVSEGPSWAQTSRRVATHSSTRRRCHRSSARRACLGPDRGTGSLALPFPTVTIAPAPGRYNGALPSGDRGRRKSRFALHKRPKANGVKPSTVHVISTPQASKERQYVEAVELEAKEVLKKLFPKVSVPSHLSYSEWLHGFEKKAKECIAGISSSEEVKVLKFKLKEADEIRTLLQLGCDTYKSVLAETEGILQKLQKSVEEEENKWKVKVDELQKTVKQVFKKEELRALVRTDRTWANLSRTTETFVRNAHS